MPIVRIIRDPRTYAEKRQQFQPGEYYELDTYWCLTEDKSRAVPEGHAEARFVLGGPGSRIALSEAKQLGLIRDPEPEPPPPEVPRPRLIKAKETNAKKSSGNRNTAKPPYRSAGSNVLHDNDSD